MQKCEKIGTDTRPFTAIWPTLPEDYQREVRAELLTKGVTYQTLWNWAQGKVKKPNMHYRKILCDVLLKKCGINANRFTLFPDN